jgi:hypothetical protein
MKKITKLTKSELKQIEDEIAMVVGDEPTIDDVISDGFKQSDWLINTLDTISGVGRVLTLMVAEAIQSLAALIIAILFAILEYQRVQHGSIALGQSTSSASLIAVAIVAANVIHPIYALRALRGQSELEIKRMTGRGYWDAFWARLLGQPSSSKVDLYHNPTLHLAASMITWTTVVLAVYDILSPLLSELFGTGLTRPLPIAIMELAMGLGLSIAGVFFLQSASHEIGVRTLTDQPQRISEELSRRRHEHAIKVEQIREQITERVMSAKVADQERKEEATPSVNPTNAGRVVQMPTTPAKANSN